MRRQALALLIATSAASQVLAAPDLFVGDIDAVKERIASLKGKPVLVNFWATWCKPCLYELPLLTKLHGEYAKQGVTFYSVSLDLFTFEEDDAMKRIGKTIEKHKVPFGGAIVRGEIEAIDEAWNLGGVVPLTVFLDASGSEVGRVAGVLQEKEARQLLAKSLKK